jgi:hypothetical protein
MKKITSIGVAATLTVSATVLSLAEILNWQALSPANINPAMAQSEITMSSTSQPKIQIAILLDSSNSMDGLIDQTRYQLWNIVNALTNVTKNGEVPMLEVALYHYGNDSIPSSEGHLRLLTGFTPELDLISEKLFAIQTNGGQEYAGWVIQSAINQLEWSQSTDNFRAIFIAGNEPFNQGSVDWKDAVNLAERNQILVNTIYCGEAESEERSLWAQGAQVGQGNHFNINHHQEIVFIESPYDEEINRLNQEFNNTYIPYGEEGEIGQTRQATEDLNAMQQSPVGGATRGGSKISSYYRNSSWDLVDALEYDVVTLEELQADELPEIMREMTLEERADYVNSQRIKREQIKQQIQQLSEQRERYVEEQRAIAQAETADSLDDVMIEILQNQLEAKGFTFTP